MQTILLAIIAGLLIINMIDMRYIKFEHESYIKRILTVLYWGIFAGALVFVYGCKHFKIKRTNFKN